MSQRKIGVAIIVALVAIPLVVYCIWSLSSNRHLRYQGRHLETWLAMLESSSPAEIASAEQAVREIGIDALPLLENLIGDTPRDSQMTMTRKMKYYLTSMKRSPGFPAELILDTISFRNKYLDSRKKVLLAYKALGEKAVPSVPFLVGQLKADEMVVRVTAIGALGMIGLSAKEAAPGLILLLDDRIYMVRMHAAISFGRIYSHSNDANIVEALEKLLDDENSDVRMQADRAITSIQGDLE
jgi:vesicle coat complex subunit